MRFGKCKECREYKYLKKEAKCTSCVEESNWFVYRIVGLAQPKLVDEGLTKEEAKNKASSDQYLIATDEEIGY